MVAEGQGRASGIDKQIVSPSTDSDGSKLRSNQKLTTIRAGHRYGVCDGDRNGQADRFLDSADTAQCRSAIGLMRRLAHDRDGIIDGLPR